MKISGYAQLVQAVKPVTKSDKDKNKENHLINIMKYSKGGKRK